MKGPGVLSCDGEASESAGALALLALLALLLLSSQLNV